MFSIKTILVVATCSVFSSTTCAPAFAQFDFGSFMPPGSTMPGGGGFPGLPGGGLPGMPGGGFPGMPGGGFPGMPGGSRNPNLPFNPGATTQTRGANDYQNPHLAPGFFGSRSFARQGQASVRNGLPPTSMDSFVLNAEGAAEAIYGDEGTDGLPPYDEFTPEHRINMGITGIRDAGLTTGHGSMLPPASGGDEFVDTEGFSMSGANYGGFQMFAYGFGMPTNNSSFPGFNGTGFAPTNPFEDFYSDFDFGSMLGGMGDLFSGGQFMGSSFGSGMNPDFGGDFLSNFTGNFNLGNIGGLGNLGGSFGNGGLNLGGNIGGVNFNTGPISLPGGGLPSFFP